MTASDATDRSVRHADDGDDLSREEMSSRDLRASASATLDAIRRLVIGDAAEVDEVVIARLSAIQAVTEAVTGPAAATAANTAVAAASSTEAFEQAVRTLLDHAGSARRAQWDRTVDTLVDCPTLDADQLYQAHRHAERKRWLLANVKLLGTSEVARLMPDRIDPYRNTARVLSRWRSEGQLLGVPVRRDWRYPAAQLDARGEVHEKLPEVVVRARSQGYDDWEILYWLSRSVAEPIDVVPGRPLETLEADASLEAIAAQAEARYAETRQDSDIDPAPVSPFELLAKGDSAAFEQAARRWLG